MFADGDTGYDPATDAPPDPPVSHDDFVCTMRLAFAVLRDMPAGSPARRRAEAAASSIHDALHVSRAAGWRAALRTIRIAGRDDIADVESARVFAAARHAERTDGVE